MAYGVKLLWSEAVSSADCSTERCGNRLRWKVSAAVRSWVCRRVSRYTAARAPIS
ncbi:hypothetical protein [Streptomyces sp. NPDC002520]